MQIVHFVWMGLTSISNTMMKYTLYRRSIVSTPSHNTIDLRLCLQIQITYHCELKVTSAYNHSRYCTTLTDNGRTAAVVDPYEVPPSQVHTPVQIQWSCGESQDRTCQEKAGTQFSYSLPRDKVPWNCLLSQTLFYNIHLLFNWNKTGYSLTR